MCLEHLLKKWKKTVSSKQRKEAEDTRHKQLRTWTTPMTYCCWQIHLPKPKSLLHCLEQAATGIDLHVNSHKTEYMCFNQRGGIHKLNGSFLKLVDKFTYLRSSVSLTETDINPRLAKVWAAIHRLSAIWKSDLTDKMKRSFFPSSSRIDTTVWMHYMDAN